MSARLREIARQTMAILEAGRYRNEAGEPVTILPEVCTAVAGTRHHLSEDPLPGPAAPPAGPLVVRVTGETTLQAARRLGPDAAGLVFASARSAGGGFRNGAQAQEESIARASALYPCLRTAPEFYAFHRADGDLRYSDRVIYCPRVPVFRDDGGRLLDRPFLTSLLVAAAPNAGEIVGRRPEHASELPGLLRRRAARVLRVAAAHGHRDLVLGAWGCGVFRNDPVVVAGAFAAALNEVPAFAHVVFAVPDPGGATHRAFADRFAAYPR